MKREISDRLSVAGNRIKKDIRQYGPGALAALLLYFLAHALFGAFCPSLLITGFPCPGCGMTRAVLCLFTGQFSRSWALNPAAVLWVAWVLLSACNRYIKGGKSKKLNWMIFGILFFMVAVYIIRMKLYFPNKPPYVYTRDNLFERILPGYGKIVGYLTGR